MLNTSIYVATLFVALVMAYNQTQVWLAHKEPVFDVTAFILPLLLVIGLVASALINLKAAQTRKTETAKKIRTRLRCRFPQGLGLPEELEKENVYWWNGYEVVAQFLVTTQSEGKLNQQAATQKTCAVVIIIFDHPIPLGRFRVRGDGSSLLPSHEIRSQTIRHMVVWFNGDMSGQVVEFESLP